MSTLSNLLRQSLGAVLALASTHAISQTLTIESSADEMARATLGNRSGYVSTGIWHFGQARYGLASGKDQAAMGGEAGTQLFEIGSISKVFTGLLLAQDIENGKLSLDDNLAKLLGARVKLTPEVGAITLRQLVTHSSCLPRMPADFESSPGYKDDEPYRDFDRAMLWASLSKVRLKKAPPCTDEYSNFGFAVLGEVLSERAGKPWEALVSERITGPLGMRDTVQHLGEKAPRLAPAFVGARPAAPWEFKAFAGAGSLRSNAADMLVFSRAMLAGRSGPLGAAAERAMQPLGVFGGEEIGYGVIMRGPAGRRVYHHEGGTGGYRANWSILSELQGAVVVLASNAQAPAGRVINDILASRFKVADTRIELDAARLASYAGVFRIDDRTAFTFVEQGGQLYGRLTGQPFSALTPSAPDLFTFPAVSAQFAFARVDGKPVSVTLSQRGATMVARRVDEPVPAQATLESVTPEAYGGRYVASDATAQPMEFEVVARGGQLFVRLNTQPMIPVFPLPGQPDRFAYDVVKAEIKFERDAAQRVDALVLYQNGNQIRAKRM